MKTAIITGGAVRLGRAIGLALASDGWQIGFTYHSSVEKAAQTQSELLAYGMKSCSIRTDLRSDEEIRSAFEFFENQFGNPDLLVNNAGVFPPPSSVSELDAKVWDSTNSINLRAQFLCSKYFSEFRGQEARIINIASRGAFESWKNRVAYNVSKSAVLQLTKSLARELAPRIAVNCVAPGYIMFESEPTEGSASAPPLHKIPMGRYARPEDVLAAIKFFASAPLYITGQTISVDGGSGTVK